MIEKTFKFKGIISGDFECFCFAVAKEDYIKIVGLEPTEFDKSPFHKNMYKLYPNDLLQGIDRENKHSFEIAIKAIKV